MVFTRNIASNRFKTQAKETNQMTMIITLKTRLAKLKIENYKMNTKFKSDEEERGHPRPSKIHVTSPPMHVKTIGESAHGANPHTTITANTSTLLLSPQKHPFIESYKLHYHQAKKLSQLKDMMA